MMDTRIKMAVCNYEYFVFSGGDVSSSSEHTAASQGLKISKSSVDLAAQGASSSLPKSKRWNMILRYLHTMFISLWSKSYFINGKLKRPCEWWEREHDLWHVMILFQLVVWRRTCSEKSSGSQWRRSYQTTGGEMCTARTAAQKGW